MSLPREIRRDVLRGTRLFAALKAEELEELLGLVTERRAVKDEAVVHRGDPDVSLMILVSGRLRAGVATQDGREVVVGLIEPGGVIGEIALLDGKPRSLDVTAMLDSVLLVVERREFLPFLMRYPDLMMRMVLVLCDRLRRSSLALENIALASLPARLARLLLRLAEDYGEVREGSTRIRIKLSQRELSAQVAATRERVNKQLRQFRDDGLIGDAAGCMIILNAKALQVVADNTEG